MTVFSKIIDEKTKELDCIECGNTPVIEGYEEIERELGPYSNKWYVKGYVPKKEQEDYIRSIRDSYMKQYVDYYQEKPLMWAELDDEFKQKIIDYRQYLKDYPESSEDWFEENPKTFEKFKGGD